MNEDEAFIRAIVENPGDDTVRLAYADWLDERDDPRGKYLRAEREAIITADISRLKELAAGLDPVWVARVSRPPVGVCCDGLTRNAPGPEVCSGDIDRFENRFGITLPTAYRAFLLNSKGVVEFRECCEFHTLAKTMSDDPRGSLEYEFAVTRDSIYRETPRGDAEYKVRLRDCMIVGRTPEHSAWVLLGLGGERPGWVRIHRRLTRSPVSADRPLEHLRFDSLPDYLFFMTRSGIRT